MKEKFVVTIMVLEGNLPHSQMQSMKIHLVSLSGTMHNTYADAQKEIEYAGTKYNSYQIQKVFVKE